MKKLLITGLLVFLIATTFQSDNPPGWYQQQLPVNDVVKDISFIDSLNGWIITEGSFNNNDTGYIMRTTNGGVNWTVQFDSTLVLNVIQFVDENFGYAGGGSGRAAFFKTTNGGIEWQYSVPFGSEFYGILDLKFINRDTGWVCSDDSFGGGVFKTTNGGGNWQRQTTPSQFRPIKLFFLNKDIGWALEDNAIFKTVNGGSNWTFLNGFGFGLKDLFFLNNDTGWIIRNSSNGIFKTTTAGLNWLNEGDPYPTNSGLNDIFILSNSKGWISTSIREIFSMNDDKVWGRQSTPGGSYFSTFMTDTNVGHSGGTIFVKTEDGGGVITNINQNSEEVPNNFQLFQNYPNPFNPKTIINYVLRFSGFVKLLVYDISGKEISELINQRQISGEYKFDFDGSNLSSGVYFYRLEVTDEKTNELFIQTNKMILTR